MGLKKNVVYSGLLTTSLYIFQFITYPYVSRVLGVNNIGICNFAQSFVLYFSLFSMFGITSLGVREIAKCNGDQIKLNKVFSEIFQFNIFLTAIVVCIYLITIVSVPQLSSYRKLLYVGAFQIIFNTLTVEWLYKGLENFQYITLRTIFVRVLYVISIFVFVREPGDYGLYFMITVGLYVLNGIINSVYSTNLIRFTRQSIKAIWCKYSRPILFLGSQAILQTMYTSFNVVYLGFVAGDKQVGYYTTATKIQGVILALYSSFTLVLMPRISSLLAQNDRSRVKRLINMSFSLLYAFAFPVIILSEILAPEIINLISGAGYESSVLLFRMAIPLILIIGIEQVLIVQLLLPLKADRAVFINSMIGGSVGLFLNVLLVGRMQSVGSIIVWTISEFAVMLSALYFVRKKISITPSVRELSKYIISFFPLFIVCHVIHKNANQFIEILVVIFVIVIYTHFNLRFIVKNPLYINMICQIRERILH
ncbi:flippase [uncultured Alistipes sp.]|uniref:flippase n=1 Tax=uncultured Alistipes sp. TaxID=538949 RepID=UPI0025EE8153|nr:flippase [uncultured Alistipes sp.]